MIRSLVSISVPIISSFSTSCERIARLSFGTYQTVRERTHLDVADNLFPRYLGFLQTLLHALVRDQTVVFCVHKLCLWSVLRNIRQTRARTVIAFTRLLEAAEAFAIAVRIWDFSCKSDPRLQSVSKLLLYKLHAPAHSRTASSSTSQAPI